MTCRSNYCRIDDGNDNNNPWPWYALGIVVTGLTILSMLIEYANKL